MISNLPVNFEKFSVWWPAVPILGSSKNTAFQWFGSYNGLLLLVCFDYHWNGNLKPLNFLI